MPTRILLATACGILSLGPSTTGCSSSERILLPHADGGADSTVDSSGGVARGDAVADRVVAKDAGGAGGFDASSAPALVAFSLEWAFPQDGSTPPSLVPPFSPQVHDYYVRCQAGPNSFRVSMKASPGADSLLVSPALSPSLPSQVVSPVVVVESQAVVAAAAAGSATVEYWIRCLPYDFPALDLTSFPEAGAPAPGYYLLGNFSAAGPTGGYAMVLDGDGVPVWYSREPSGGTSDVDDVVKDAITYLPTYGGPLEIHQLSPPHLTSTAPTGVPLDFHEMRALANGHYLAITSPSETGVDLTGLDLPAPDGGKIALGPGWTIKGCDLVEFDPGTGAVVWTWRATDHFDPAKDCTEPIYASHGDGAPAILDTFHCNSIDVDPSNGNLLVSARQMDSVFYVERVTGTVLWKMGGASASLDGATYVPVESPFNQQHDARLSPGWSACSGGQVTLFDDETGPMTPARAVVYDVVLGGGDGGCGGGGPPGAAVAWQHAGTKSTPAGGSFRVQADGSKVIGWGLQYERVFTELDATGNVVLELRSPYVSPLAPISMLSYRAIKVPLAAFSLDAMRRAIAAP